MHRIFSKLSLKIAHKLPILFVLIAMISVISVGAFSINSTSDTLVVQKKQTLRALAEARNSSLNQYLESIKEDIVITAANSNIQDALSGFTDGFLAEKRLNSDPVQSLQSVYINEQGLTSTSSFGNKEALGQKHLFNGPSLVEGTYHTQHQRFHPWFRQMLEGRDYYDIFLIDPEGNVVYTVFKELDYATNLLDGKYNQTGLAQAFKAALSNKKEGNISFIDFAPYAPSNGAPASFIATPVISRTGFQGVLVFQMPINRINQVLQLSAGMGKTGETYLVGSDYLMRSDSRFSEESTILKTKVKTDTVLKALEGESGIEITPDYRGIPVLSAYQPFEFQDTRWALIAEIDEQEMLAPAREERLFILMIGAIVLAMVALLGWLFARSIVRPLQRSTSEMLQLAAGDKSFEVTGLERQDEVGNIASALQTFKDNAIKQDRMVSENLRIKSALDSCQANVMVANNDFDIIYMNDAVLNMMREGEADIRKDLTGFDCNKLLGGSIDRFHKSPAHQR
ncbi:cache domain-containing protein, partial [Kiloniella majae]|uniref:cache domain-containing protein n=1 Tax=Kiloniella majae TaxID=1938558 RepID=UPI000A278FAC